MDKEKLKAALLANDTELLKEIKADLARERWLKSFNGNIPISAWLKPNPFIRFDQSKIVDAVIKQ
ncbi:hypothetical protein ACVWYG_000722 [Pedobacter sp. UYEF25]